jgi:hypothetical protein
LDRDTEHFHGDDDGQPRDHPAPVVRHNHVTLFLHKFFPFGQLRASPLAT